MCRHEQAAWEQLLELYAPLVFYWCRQSHLSPEDSADVVQETFFNVARSIRGAQFGEGRSFCGWLWTVTRSRICDHFRRRCSTEPALGGTDAQRSFAEIPDQYSDEPTDSGEREQRRALLFRALDQVKAEFEPRTWKAFWRVTVDGLSTAETATELGLTSNNVRQAKSRVLRRLRQQLGDE